MKLPALREILAAASGALTVGGFAPYHFWPAPILSMTVLMLLWRHTHSPVIAARLGFFWGLGLFTCGVGWIEISLHDYGGMPFLLAVAAILIFCVGMSLYPALVGYLTYLFFSNRPKTRWLVGVPALWTLAEWMRDWFLTGFPWLSLGYAQTPHGPLAGFAPILGVFGVTGTSVLASGLLTTLVTAHRDRHSRSYMGLAFLVLMGTGWALQQVSWTQAIGPSISVNLLQGNFSQNEKFQPENTDLIVERYAEMLKGSTGKLVLMPESALPYVRQQMPESQVEQFERYGYEHMSDLLVGMFSEPDRGQYYNSVYSFGHSPSQFYQKVHLVPFGEFIPAEELLKPLIHNVLSIPLDSQQRGDPAQRPLRVGGQWVAVSICYEDAFGEELLHELPQATLLANFTNDAWFGNSIGPEQHLQMAQTRSLETGREMMRVTNTGVTALIDEKGALISRAPRGQIFNLAGMVQGFSGRTPFVLVGNYGILGICIVALVLTIPLSRRRP